MWRASREYAEGTSLSPPQNSVDGEGQTEMDRKIPPPSRCCPRQAVSMSLPSKQSAGLAGQGGSALPAHLHDNVEGKVKKQVADANGQQVGGKIIGTHDEPIGRPGRREDQLVKQGTAKSKEGATPQPSAPTLCFMRMWGRVQRPTEDSRTPGANTCLLGPHFSCPYLSTAPKGASGWPSPQLPTQPGDTDDGWTHSDQLMMLPMTSSTMRSWREAETQGLRDGREGEGGLGQQVPSLPHPGALSFALPTPTPPVEEGVQTEEEGPGSWAGTT